jgi:hypothetical protein
MPKVPISPSADMPIPKPMPSETDLLMSLAVMKDLGRFEAEDARNAAAYQTRAGVLGFQGYRGDLKVNRVQPQPTNPRISSEPESMPQANLPDAESAR